VFSSASFNFSRPATVFVAAVTSNLRLAQAPGNVALTSPGSGLPKESAVNVSQLLTIDRRLLGEQAGALSLAQMRAVDNGLRLVLNL
jgi:mRNA interferase MazF